MNQKITDLRGIRALVELGEVFGEQQKSMKDEFKAQGVEKNERGNYECSGVEFSASARSCFGGPEITLHIKECNEYDVYLTVEGDTVKECLDKLPSIRKFLDAVKANERFILIGELLKEFNMGDSVKFSFGNLFILQPWMCNNPLVIPEDVQQNYAELDMETLKQYEEGNCERGRTTCIVYNLEYVCHDGVWYFVVLDEEFDEEKLHYIDDTEDFLDIHKYKFVLVDPKGFMIPDKAPIIATQSKFYRSLCMKFDEYYKIVTSLNPPDVKFAGNKK